MNGVDLIYYTGANDIFKPQFIHIPFYISGYF